MSRRSRSRSRERRPDRGREDRRYYHRRRDYRDQRDDYRRRPYDDYRRRSDGGRYVDRRRDNRRDGSGRRRGGAAHLARIHGTEDDRVNCPFYFKIGACRHGDRCSRLHNVPAFSQTVLIPHMYPNPLRQAVADKPEDVQHDPQKMEEDFEDFYEEVFEEFASFGYVEEMHVVDNLGDHIVGHVYVKFRREEDAEACKIGLTGKYYKGQLLKPEFSPVTDFREARCRQFDETKCSRGAYCNFMHIKEVSRSFRKELLRDQDDPSSSSSSGSSSSSDSGSEDDGKEMIGEDTDERDTSKASSSVDPSESSASNPQAPNESHDAIGEPAEEKKE